MPTPDPQTADCVFCAIVRGDVVVAFMDIRPVQPGHLLIVPRIHAKLIPELDDGTLASLWSTATDLNRALRRSAPPVEAVSVYVADGEAAGQEVAHVHIHLIPRRAHDAFGFRFPPGYGTEPGRLALETIADQIRRRISELSAPGNSGH
jgi:histidine triad (HIT) family protein